MGQGVGGVTDGGIAQQRGCSAGRRLRPIGRWLAAVSPLARGLREGMAFNGFGVRLERVLKQAPAELGVLAKQLPIPLAPLTQVSRRTQSSRCRVSRLLATDGAEHVTATVMTVLRCLSPTSGSWR